MNRKRLPDRRGHWLCDFQHGGHRFTGGIGRFDDAGQVSEIFVNGAKVGSHAEISAQESALAVSLALQFGCPLETIRHAMTCDGAAFGPIGALLLELDREAQPMPAAERAAE